MSANSDTPLPRYKCEECGWIGTVKEMGADYVQCGEDEQWSNHICPQCGLWQDLSDYTKVKDE